MRSYTVGQVCIQAGTFELGFVWMSTRIVAVESTDSYSETDM